MEDTIRILIAGGPKTGKTTSALAMSKELGVPVQHTDSLIDRFDWSGVSLEASRWIDQAGPWIIEGVAVPRALRKWLAAHPTGKPCDRIYWLETAKVLRSAGQVTMAKGCLTVWNEILPALRARGVDIISTP